MNPGNSNGSNRWATTIKAATLVVMVGTLAAVTHPLLPHPAAMGAEGPSQGASAVTTDSPATPAPDMSVYFPAQFPAPEHDYPQAPTF